MAHNLKERIGKVFKNAAGVEKIVIVNTGIQDPNFLYITGFTSGLFEYSYLVMDEKGAKLFTSALEYETAVEQDAKGLDIIKIENRSSFVKMIKEEIEGSVVGINGAFLPYQIYKSIEKHKPGKIEDVSEAFLKARLVKDADEVARIRKAASITKWALMLIQKEFKEGMTEHQLAAKFDNLCSSMGSQGPSFRTIVCFGKDAALPHHFPDDTKLKYGDFVLIDAGCLVDNYASDMTRTFVFGREKATLKDYKEMDEMMKVVKDAQVRAIKAIRPGVKGKEIDKAARDYIEGFKDGKYKGTFIHSLGHSLGLEVHDGPGFSPREETVIKKDMVITVEPGIYINGFGGVRIEDDVLVTKDGALVL